MKKLLTVLTLGALLVPAGAAQAGTTTTPTDSKNAAKFCKQLRTTSGGGENFRSAVDALMTSKVTAKNAYGKCVSFYAKDEAKERTSAQKQAVADCKKERDEAVTDEQKAAFATKYGAKNSNSAYGKCVSSKAKANKDEADENDQERINAAKACKTERGTTTEKQQAFKTKYRNFGKCVSEKARAQNS